MKNLFTLWLVVLSVKTVSAGTVLSVPNPIGSSYFAPISELYFVGSAQPSTGDNAAYALAVAGPGSTSFAGISPQNILVNNVEQANPLYGAQIELLSSMGRYIADTDRQNDALPLVTITSDPEHAYVVTSYVQSQDPSLVISSALQDSNGNPVGGIDAITGCVQGVAFALVHPQGGAYGDSGSGLCMANLMTTTVTSLQFYPTTALGRNSPVVAITDPLQSMVPTQLYVSSYKAQRSLSEVWVGTLFLSFNVVGGSNPSDGALSVVSTLGEVGNALLLSPIVTTSALTSDSIVGAVGANVEVYAHAITTLFPSVGTQYLVVVGGVGSGNSQPINVYALPLTSSGMLANVNVPPFALITNNLFVQREFTTVAAQPGDLYSSSSVPAQVGGGSAPGQITSVWTFKDAVLITVTDTTTQAPGIYASQAIFNTNAQISGWTPWQPAVLTQGEVNYAVYDPQREQFWYTTALTTSTQNVVYTSWDTNGLQLSQLLNSTFPLEEGGIQGVTDLVSTASLFSQTIGSRMSASIFTGYQGIVLAQTAQDSAGQLTPVTTYPTYQALTDGTLQGLTLPTPYMALSGGALTDLTAIIASTLISDGTQTWIAVGGNGGLAVLALSNGQGIPNGSISAGFTGLSNQLAWKMVGNYSNVRKLVSQNGFLYVLTDTFFERIAVTADLIAGVTPFSSTTLAQAGTLPNAPYLLFSDLLVSQPLVLLATSSGLLRGGNGVSVQTASSQQAMNWTPVTMPESPGCATRLWAITQTGQPTDLYLASPGVSGNVYVLAGAISFDQARLYRYSISYDPSGVTDSTVQPFSDFFVQNQPTFYTNFGSYRNFFYTDGLLWSVSRSKYLKEPLFVQALPSILQTGSRARVAQKGGFFTQLTAHSVGQLMRLSGLRSWVIPGDFGLAIHH